MDNNSYEVLGRYRQFLYPVCSDEGHRLLMYFHYLLFGIKGAINIRSKLINFPPEPPLAEN